DSLSDVVHRPKRRFKPEELAAANQVLDSLYLGQRRIGAPDPPPAPSTEPAPPPPTKKKPTQQQKKIQKKKGKQARQAKDDDDPDPDENAVEVGDSEDRLVGENGKVTLQIPGKLFGTPRICSWLRPSLLEILSRTPPSGRLGSCSCSSPCLDERCSSRSRRPRLNRMIFKRERDCRQCCQ
ncbi:hypothetical protein pipiens_005845, partial [Culex pipiens pipiens]